MQVDDIINQAYLRVGGAPITGQNVRDARIALNLLFIDLLNRGAPLAKVEYKTLNLVSGTSTYTLPQSDVDVLDLVIRDTDDVDTSMNRVSLGDYNRMPTKDTPGTPTQYVTKRERDAVKLTVWPVPNTSGMELRYYSITRVSDVLTSRQEVDFSFRYLPAIISGLAYYLSLNIMNFDKDLRVGLKQDYEEQLDRARVEDMERVSYQITPFGY